MNRPSLILSAFLFVSSGGTGNGRDDTKAADPAAIQVKLPGASVKVSYVEDTEGMMIHVESKGVTVKGKRVYLGDGTVAVEFAAVKGGFLTPDGVVNRAGVDYPLDSVIKVTPKNRRAWGAIAGAVYVHAPGLVFEVAGEK